MRSWRVAAVTAAFTLVALPAGAAAAGGDRYPGAGGTGPARPVAHGKVTYRLDAEAAGPRPRTYKAALHCGGETGARARLVEGRRTVQTRRHHAAGEVCTVRTDTATRPGRADEVTFTVRQGEEVWARSTRYSHDGEAVSTGFRVPAGELDVEIAIESLPADRIGTPLRLMAFNIWRSGTLDGREGAEAGAENLRQLIEFVRSEDPDVLFVVETYGSGDTILDGLNTGRPAGDRYTAVQVTREPDTEPGTDNLWLFTTLEVERVYPAMRGGDLTSFNFGGARLGLRNGEHIHAFSTWLHHTDGAWNLTNQSALESELGLSRTYTEEEIVGTDQPRRLGMATTLLQERLEAYVHDDAPVFLGGDFNTLSHLDWSSRFADAPGHGGLVLDWPVLRMFDEAGFIDTYRWANPDAARFPGRTWSPYAGFGYAPGRIDYVLARGEQVRVLAAHTRTTRLDAHQHGPLDAVYPFYSDHGAVISDVLVRGPGPGPGPTAGPEYDEPETGSAAWPEPPPGAPVPPGELTATASTENANGTASRAVDGDLRTHWHSQYSPEPTPPPHRITVDMGRVRTLSALRYQPRVVGNLNGTVLRATVQVSQDGAEFRDVADVDWERTTVPKDVDLSGISARYVRLHIELGIGGFSSAAEITPYEQAG